MLSEAKKQRWREKRRQMRRLARRLAAEARFREECGVNDPVMRAVAKRMMR